MSTIKHNINKGQYLVEVFSVGTRVTSGLYHTYHMAEHFVLMPNKMPVRGASCNHPFSEKYRRNFMKFLIFYSLHNLMQNFHEYNF